MRLEIKKKKKLGKKIYEKLQKQISRKLKSINQNNNNKKRKKETYDNTQTHARTLPFLNVQHQAQTFLKTPKDWQERKKGRL